MSSQFAPKGLPPPPLRIDKQRSGSQPWPTGASGSNMTSTGRPSHIGLPSQHQENGPTEGHHTNSGRFRIRVPSLTRQQSRSSEAGPSNPPVATRSRAPSSASSQAPGKAWQPRWAPKLKRTTPSESVTTYSPILDGSLPLLPPSAASPPPAVQLDDAGFGLPFSASGLLDLNASRFSFLDMSNKDQDSDSDGEGAKPGPFPVVALPTIREPPLTQDADGRSPLTASSSVNGRYAASAAPSSSLRGEISRDTLEVPLPSSPLPGDASHSPQVSLPISSPAWASLISSFPSPTGREASSNEAASISQLSPAEPADDKALHVRPAMFKENSWDGGERWDAEAHKHGGLAGSDASTELPYLDMDEDDTELLEASFSRPSAETMQPTLSSSSSMSQSKNRTTRNLPPRPAPTMALPDLPPNTLASSQATVRRHTPSNSVQFDNQQQVVVNTSGRPSRQAQKPLILPTLRSSASIDRLATMKTADGPLNASPSNEPLQAKTPNGSNLKSLTLRRNASTDELAKSLDIPRETVQQMLDTTQHVWRNHLLDSAAALQIVDETPNHSSDRLSRSSSTPMLSTLFASQGSSDDAVACEDLSKGSVARPLVNRGSNRTLTPGLPYISSSRPSFEQQSPGWALSKSSMDAARPSTMALQAERAKHRRTFLGRGSEDGPTASYNFSRPIRRDADATDAELAASVSMPALSAIKQAPKPPALLQSPLLLKGESEATGFTQFVVNDEQEILAYSGSEAHQTFTLPRVPPKANVTNAQELAGVQKSVLALPQQDRNPSPRLVRRNSDTVLNRFAPEFGKRAPGELHAWSVCIDDDGVPAIRPSPSAFHRPSCPLAGKNNATWQCGCRGDMAASLKKVATSSGALTSFAGNLQVSGPSSPGRNRSLSASNVLDPVRQAQLWNQVEKNKELIRKHEQEIAGLQEQVVRISTEISSGRPSISSAFATPDISSLALFPAPPRKANYGESRKPLPSIASSESDRSAPLVPTKASGVEPFPSVSATPEPAAHASVTSQPQPPRTLRGRITSMSKMNLAGRDEDVCASQPLDLGHSRLRSSSSTSSLNKVFRFPWLRSTDKQTAYPQPTPFPLGQSAHGSSASSASVRDEALPNVQMFSADGSRPLPAPPLSDTTSLNKDKRYPPSSRKYSYEMLYGPAFHTSVGSRHLRGRSGSSKSSSFGTSIFSSNESNEVHESSRFASFPKLGRRWDSISSRGTNVSARNSAEVAQRVGPSYGSMPALSSVANKPMPIVPIEKEAAPRHYSAEQPTRPKTPPPRRSSLLRRSLEVAPPARRTLIPTEFLQANDAVMAPISEQSEMGSPASVRLATIHADLEMSPASVVGTSPAGGPARMSLSERYRLQGLTVPAPLPLSSSHASSLTSPALGSAAEPDSGTKVGEAPRSPSSPRSARMPLPAAFSHGTLTAARRPSLK
ncbi:uncharacterized protein UBRO2_02571 [Ustilago bromivora]|uniref:Uncharacterized protein n=1 Tax=Ustilago bromivora TaxID=307758 RepID=A0A8H8QL64_9BASI|nr:uncharacterized protein UBRO2_02571 [Ustilago bromivora]